MSTIIYSIISSDKEFISYKKNYGSLIVPKDHKLILIDNRSDKSNVLDIKSVMIVKNKEKISLVNNIKLLLLKFNDEFFIRLDPDDFCDNDYVEKVSFFAKAGFIVSGNIVVKYPNDESFILNKANGQYLNYEILGAGVVLHRKIILESLSISYNLFGQDNFAIWLVAKEQKISFLNIDSNYFYMQNNQISMSSNSTRIVSERLKDYKELSGENINLIINNCNLDRMKLNNELEKIETYFQDKVLKNEQLSILLNSKTSENFNLLKDEAFKGNKKKTNELLSETVIEQEKNIYYLNLINNRLNKLNEIQNKENVSNLIHVINNLKPPIFWKDKPNLIEQAKKWDKKKVNIMLNKTYEIERLMKSNASIDKNVLLKKVILDLCTLANS